MFRCLIMSVFQLNTWIFVGIISWSALSQASRTADTGLLFNPRHAQSNNSDTAANNPFFDPMQIDQFAIELEALRLRVLLARSLGHLTPPLFTLIYEQLFDFVLNPQNNASLSDVERSLRRINSGIFLFAVHKLFITDTHITIYPLPGKPATQYWLFLSVEGPDMALTDRTDFAVGSDEENLRLLDTVGILVHKQKIP